MGCGYGLVGAMLISPRMRCRTPGVRRTCCASRFVSAISLRRRILATGADQ
ncbi:MAG: hypothetical protein OJF49_003150 [Ktedonobacterales bacterium]|nr:MAG: hypothetical protein OJF49_003150 [Ktedonobacterales bacterium]